jgi:hypothetical protein
MRKFVNLWSVSRMTNEEALNILYKGIAPDSKSNDECINLCKKALEKQIAKKPIRDMSGSWCPTCNEYFDEFHDGINEKYCYNCGQALDWSAAE